MGVCVSDYLRDYVDSLDGEPCAKLYDMTMDVVEKELIIFALKHCDGSLTATAKILGMSRTTLNKKMTMRGLRR